MANFARVCILMLVMFTSRHLVTGEMYQFFLDILDMLDPTWISSKHDSIATKIECASICYRDKDFCSYFGYKGNTCYLLKDSVDRDTCSQDDCYDSGMKIYKWKHEITTTEEPSTSTTTTSSTTTAATTTTTAPTSTTTAVSEETTTTTTPSTTTTTESTTTTTKETTTTTTEGTTTTTPETPIPTTTTTTTEVPTTTTTATTTTEAPTTTTTEITTTTTEVTSTTEGWNCEPPEGAAADVECKLNTFLLNAMGTRYPFLTDAVAGNCSNMQEQVYVDEEEVYTFFTVDGGFTLNSKCPHSHHVIQKFKLCVKDKRPTAISLHCRLLKDPSRIQELYNVTTNDVNTLVNCSDYSAIQSITFRPHEKPLLTKIDFSCVKVEVKEVSLPVDAPDTSDTGGVG